MNTVRCFCSSRYKYNKKALIKHAAEYAARLSLKGDIDIAIIGSHKMKTLSATYKHENDTLPVLTFTYNEEREEGFYKGEVCICYPLAIVMASERNKKVDDMLIILLEHGIKNFTLSK
jgi:ssRNA-specific RNase YbeY (16S rRNA maturation enzyme)